jgi:hypothetical protein
MLLAQSGDRLLYKIVDLIGPSFKEFSSPKSLLTAILEEARKRASVL